MAKMRGQTKHSHLATPAWPLLTVLAEINQSTDLLGKFSSLMERSTITTNSAIVTTHIRGPAMWILKPSWRCTAKQSSNKQRARFRLVNMQRGSTNSTACTHFASGILKNSAFCLHETRLASSRSFERTSMGVCYLQAKQKPFALMKVTRPLLTKLR